MKIAVISDLHLGLGDATDKFAHDDLLFLRFLDFLESKYDKIVLLGDITETLTTKKFNDKSHGFIQSWKTHKAIFDRFNSEKYVYIFGNHDRIASEFFSASERFELTYQDKKILFLHGYQFDKFVSKHYLISEIGVWISGWLSRAKIPNVGFLFEDLNDKFRQIKSHPFHYRAIEYAKKHKYDIIVTGHSHIRECIVRNDVIFLNAGSCSRGRFAFGFLDLDDEKYCISIWKPDK